jgi:hypothetical protein
VSASTADTQAKIAVIKVNDLWLACLNTDQTDNGKKKQKPRVSDVRVVDQEKEKENSKQDRPKALLQRPKPYIGACGIVVMEVLIRKSILNIDRELRVREQFHILKQAFFITCSCSARCCV